MSERTFEVGSRVMHNVALTCGAVTALCKHTEGEPRSAMVKFDGESKATKVALGALWKEPRNPEAVRQAYSSGE